MAEVLPDAPLMDVPVTASSAWDEATHSCGKCGALLRLAADRNWSPHRCHAGGRKLTKGFATVYPTEDEMRFGPSVYDAAEWEFIQRVIVPSRSNDD